MKKYSSLNNNASCWTESNQTNHCHDQLSNSSYNSQTLNTIRSIMDELYQITNHEILSRNQLINNRSKVDCSVSTNNHPSLQCNSATRTMDTVIFPESNHSLMLLCIDSNHLHRSRSRSNITLSTRSISPKPTTIRGSSSLSIPNHSLDSCENSNTVTSLSTVHELIIPSAAIH